MVRIQFTPREAVRAARRAFSQFSFFWIAPAIGVMLTALGCTPGLIGLNGSTASALLSTPITGFTYTYSVGAYVRGFAVPSNSPILATGAAASYSISAALPTGMSFNTSTGIISGTPSADTSNAATPDYTDYTITATNSVSSASVTIKLLVMQGYYVNNTAFTADASTATPACDIGDGSCTLRAAVQQANFTGGKQLIYLTDGTYTLTAGQTLGGGSLTDLVLCGASQTGAVVSGGGTVRPFTTGANNVNLKFCNMTIQNGTTGSCGGAVYIQNATARTFEFRSTRFMNNTSTASGGGLCIDNAAHTVTVDRSHFESNSATGGAQGGGALLHNNGNTTITRTTFKSNTTPSGPGAGILLFNVGSLTCNGCLFQSNVSAGDGGAISVANSAALTVLNSTFTANSAPNGGAIDFTGTTATHSVSFSTFYANSATAGNGGALLESTTPQTLTTTANIFDSNTATALGAHCYRNAGTWTKGGYTVTTSAGGICDTAGTGDVNTASTGIATTLAYNNGEVLNLIPNSSSPAVNLVPLATCAAVTTDVRDSVRPSGALCDAGAVER